MPDPVLGIDLGTSNSAVATVRDGLPEVLRDAEGRSLQPSVVSFHPSGSILVGHDAKGRLLLDPENTVFSAKRLIGRPFANPTAQDFLAKVPFHAVEGENQEILIQAREERMTLPELSAFVLHHLKIIAERALRQMVRKAVITVPANFNDAQRAATLAAGETAGLEVLRILNEPTAAALSYGYGKNLDRRVIIYDFGGGTFDVTILDIRGDLFEVRATAGDTYLGGNDLDARLVEILARRVLEQHRYDPREDERALGRLRQAAEEAKCELSFKPHAVVDLEDLVPGPGGKEISFHHDIDRSTFEKLVEDLVDRTFVICDEAFHLAGLRANQIDEVVLVGGTTRIPLVRRSVQSYFARTPLASINPDEVVALGAALQGAALMGQEAKAPGTPETTPRPSRPPPPPGPPAPPSTRGPPKASPPAPPPASRAGGPPPVLGPLPDTRFTPPPIPPPTALPWAPGTTLPAAPEAELNAELDARAELERTPPTLPDTPPSPPSLGVAMRRPLLLDVTPLSLGVATVGGYSQVIIPRNSPVPVEASRSYVTSEDGQTLVSIRICQGESKRFEDNIVLGELHLEGLRAAPRGEVQIRVTFEIDTSGILEASATDERTGKVHKATIQLRGRADGPKSEARISGEEGNYRLARDADARAADKP